MKRDRILFIMLLSILSIAGLFTWLVLKMIYSPSSSGKLTNPVHASGSEKGTSMTTPEKKVVVPKIIARSSRPPPTVEKERPRPAPYREVEWSTLSSRLTDIEKQCTTLITTLLPQLPPEVESEELSEIQPNSQEDPPPVAKPSFVQVTWAGVGKQLIEIEKQREQMIHLFTERGKHEVSQP